MVKVNKASTKEVEKKNLDSKKDGAKDESKISTSIKGLPIKNLLELKRVYDLPDELITPLTIIHKMAEILEFYLKNIQQILQPEEFHSIYECNAFNDTDKAKLFDLYKRIIITHREILKAEIINDEKNSISTIQFVHEEIQAVKPLMLDVVDKMQQSWKIDSSKDVQRGPKQYFG